MERPQASVESQPGEEPKSRSAAATVLGRKSSANHNYQRHPSNYDYRRQSVWWDSFFVRSASDMCKRTHSSEEPSGIKMPSRKASQQRGHLLRGQIPERMGGWGAPEISPHGVALPRVTAMQGLTA